MGKRRAGRELALKLLFQIDVGKLPPEEAFALAAVSSRYDEEAFAFARELVEGVLRQATVIDEAIQGYAREWTLDRMPNLDRNILRIAVLEVLFSPGVPAAVAADEAVEMANKYSTAESGRFINGILGSLIRDHPRPPVPSSPEPG
jgi:N utilization substance protein B